MKHAILIIANKDLYVLNKLIESVDYINNDIYLLLDKKSSILNDDIIDTKYSKLYFVKRIDIQWGSFSQIKAEMAVFKEASKVGYDYYHLISGQDLLIKKHDYFDSFFEKNNGKNFIAYCGKDWTRDAKNRIKYYYLTIGRSKLKSRLNKVFITVQKILHINRNKKIDVYGGSNWVSLTDEAVRYLVDNEKKINKIFKHSYCADELFVHTMILNSNLKDTIYYLNESEIQSNLDTTMYSANQRYIDWNRGKPYTFKKDDFTSLIESDSVFARKFDSSVDKEIIDMILDYILK